eukprot:UN02999
MDQHLHDRKSLVRNHRLQYNKPYAPTLPFFKLFEKLSWRLDTLNAWSKLIIKEKPTSPVSKSNHNSGRLAHLYHDVHISH